MSVVSLDRAKGWTGQLRIQWLGVRVVFLLVNKVIEVERGVGGQLWTETVVRIREDGWEIRCIKYIIKPVVPRLRVFGLRVIGLRVIGLRVFRLDVLMFTAN